MKDKLDNIFSESDCITEDMMYAYLEDKLTPKARHLVEIHLASCDMCTDAIEGLSLIQDKVKKIRGIVSEINEKINAKTLSQKENPFWGWITNPSKLRSIAAIIVLFIISGSVFIILNNSKKDKDDKLFAEKFEPFKSKEIGDSISSNHQETKGIIQDKEKSLEGKQTKAGDKDIVQNKLSEQDIPLAPTNSPAKFRATAGDYKIDNVNKNEEASPAAELQMDEFKAIDRTIIPPDLNVLTKDDKSVINTTPQAQSNADIQSTTTLKNGDINVRGARSESQKYNVVSIAKSSTKPSVITKNEIANSKYKALKKEQKSADSSAPTMPISQGYSNNASPSSQLFQWKNSDNNFTSVMDSAMKQYEEKDYAGANGNFKQILVSDPANYNALFYSAVSYLSLNKPDSAILNLDKVLKIKDGEFYEAAQWYKSLAFIKQNKKNKAKKLLNEIIANGGSYKSKAEATLKELDK